MMDDSKHIGILSLPETHLSQIDEPQAQVVGYTFTNRPRKSGKSGGVGPYTSSGI